MKPSVSTKALGGGWSNLYEDAELLHHEEKP